MDRTTLLSPLGFQRLRILDCLGGNSPRAPGYFAPVANADIHEAFRAHVAGLLREWATATDPHTISLLAAARLLTGELDAAEVILMHLPVIAVKLDHGMGICQVAPLYALATALPLPAELADTKRWQAGAQEPAALRAWLVQHRKQLLWLDAPGVYQLDEGS